MKLIDDNFDTDTSANWSGGGTDFSINSGDNGMMLASEGFVIHSTPIAGDSAWIRFRIVGAQANNLIVVGADESGNGIATVIDTDNMEGRQRWITEYSGFTTWAQNDKSYGTATLGAHNDAEFYAITIDREGGIIRLWTDVTASEPDSLMSWDGNPPDDTIDFSEDYSLVGAEHVGFGGWSSSTTQQFDDFTAGNFEGGDATPVISGLSDTTLAHGQTGIVITGTNFSESGNTVLISPTDDVEDVDAVAQTITAESATEITFTADLDSFDFGATLYLFVINGDSESNADGEAVTRIIGSATLSATFIGQDDQARPNLTDIKISIWRGGTISGAPDQQITAETTDESGLFETEIEVGALEYGDKPFVVVEVGSPPTIWTCGLKDVTYE